MPFMSLCKATLRDAIIQLKQKVCSNVKLTMPYFSAILLNLDNLKIALVGYAPRCVTLSKHHTPFHLAYFIIGYLNVKAGLIDISTLSQLLQQNSCSIAHTV